MTTRYADRRVLVLGGLGFVGMHLTNALLDAGAGVTVVTRSRARHLESAVAFESRGARVIEGDVRDADAMRAAVDGQRVIFNLAGESGAVASMQDPAADLDVNCRGALTVLEAIRRHNPAALLVFTGSRLEYGRPSQMPVPEDSRMAPLCLHAVHKLMVEEYLAVYRRVYGTRSVVARLTNPYGPGQPESRVAYGVVNRLVHLALERQALPIYGDGAQQRDYIYVGDAVEALLAIGDADALAGSTYNIGSGVGTRLVDMAARIIEQAGGGRVEFAPWPELALQIETGDFVADISRAAGDLGWRPRVSLDEGLRRTVAFYRAGAARS